MLTDASQAITRCRRGFGVLADQHRVPERPAREAEADADADRGDQRRDSGPAAAIRNSTPAESLSRESRATPPNIHSVDLGDRDAVADRDQGMAELVEQDRAEEQEGAGHREAEGPSRFARPEHLAVEADSQ